MFKANNRICANISTGESEQVINNTAELRNNSRVEFIAVI
jgi:hypothetical protein